MALEHVVLSLEDLLALVFTVETERQRGWVADEEHRRPPALLAEPPSRRLVPARVVPPARLAGWPLDKCAKGPGVVLRDP